MKSVTVTRQAEWDALTDEVLLVRINSKEHINIKSTYNRIVQIYGCTSVNIFGYSRVRAFDDACINTYEHSCVEAYDRSKVIAFGHSRVITHDRSSIYVFDYVIVYAFGFSNIHGYGHSRIHTYDHNYVHINESSYLHSDPFDITSWLAFHKLVPDADSYVILYKRVSSKWLTQEGNPNETAWPPGATLEHPAWNPYQYECGAGKYYACADAGMCNQFRSTVGDRYVSVRVAVKDLYMWPNPVYPSKIAFRKGTVLEEVTACSVCHILLK